MDIKKLQAVVVDALEDVKGQDIVLFDTMHLTSLFDRICVASGTSNRQTRALASSVVEKVKEAGGAVEGVEGEDTGEWVLVDLGDMIVHIMQPAIRQYYRLEEIWGDKPVKLGAAKRKSSAEAKAIDDTKPKRSKHLASSKLAEIAEPVIEKKPAVKRPAARKAAAKTAVPEGKKVKVATTKTASASAKAAKEKKAAAAPATPAKKVIKRVVKKAAADE